MKFASYFLKAVLLFAAALFANFAVLFAQTAGADSVRLGEAVVTGTREAADNRHLPQTVTTVGRQALTEHERTSVLPTLMEQVPGLMITSRGMMGYGVAAGGSGGMMLRGISSGAGQVMVLIDGHPQYNGIFGHSIADAYQTLMAERVEVLRGPASLLYGSNAMGGVVNIVTRGTEADGHHASINLGAGSWGTISLSQMSKVEFTRTLSWREIALLRTVQSEAGYSLRQGKFSLTASGGYNRSDNHRPHMGFEQYGGFAKAAYGVGRHWNIFATADITHFSASYPGTVSAPMLEADQWITRGALTLGIENRYRRTSGRLSLYDNFGRHKINDGYNASGGSKQTRLFRSRDALLGVSWYQSALLGKGTRMTLGADFQHIYGHAFYTSRSTGEVLHAPNKQSGEERNGEYAAYVDVRQEICPWLTAEVGVRYDWHTHGRWRVDTAGGHRGAGGKERRAETDGEQGVPQSHDARALSLSAFK